MGGGLMQLVAYGAQDIYLTGNPQITFFKVVYRRHTNFSMESIQQTWAGVFSDGAGRCTATIARNGDLVNRLYIEVDGSLDAGTGGNDAAQWINTVECEIGGQTIDRQYGHWMETWAELTEPNPTGYCGKAGSASGPNFQIMSQLGNNRYGVHAVAGNCFIPLRFWFCENPGLALPLIALQYHEVKIIVNGNPMNTCDNPQLWADYIYLDTDERRRFAQVSHEYLITQIQYQNFSSDNSTCTLTFNHPVKELIWTGKWRVGDKTDTDNVNGTFHQLHDEAKFQLKLNGHDRFAARDRNYFTVSQVWQYHSGYGNASDSHEHGHGVAVYSFALKPEEHQPSGTCNFSRIDNAQLVTTGVKTADAGNLEGYPNNIYAVNYNVLRIMSGMGGLAYSN